MIGQRRNLNANVQAAIIIITVIIIIIIISSEMPKVNAKHHIESFNNEGRNKKSNSLGTSSEKP